MKPSWVVRALPWFLVGQLGLLLAMQPLHEVLRGQFRFLGWAGKADDFGAGVLLFLLMAGLGTSIFATVLPRAITSGGGDLARCYSVEVAGSLTGLVLMPFLAAISHQAVLGAYLLGAIGLLALLGAGRPVRWVMAMVAVAFLVAFPSLDRAAASETYRRVYGWKVEDIPFTRFTPYHKIEVVRANGEPRLLLNGLRQFGGDPRRTYSYFVSEVPARLMGAPRVALLGCGSMATVGRIGDIAESIRIVDLDAEVFAAARHYFRRENRLGELTNWTFEEDDAKHWLANAQGTFDLILHDIPPAHSRQVALTYTDEFFRLVKARLAPRGVFSISCLDPVTGKSEYGRRMLATLTSVFDRYYAIERRGSLFFYGGGLGLREVPPSELLRRLDPEWRDGSRPLTRGQIRALCAGTRPITISNVGDLIYE